MGDEPMSADVKWEYCMCYAVAPSQVIVRSGGEMAHTVEVSVDVVLNQLGELGWEAFSCFLGEKGFRVVSLKRVKGDVRPLWVI
jgi:hypothetical protein